jgi:hypothetical protein
LISPNAAASQNAVVPPLPSATSYPSGRENSELSPRRISPTSDLTGFCLWEVPMMAEPALPRCSSASGRTFEGPHPNRPSAGFSSSGIAGAAFAATWLVVMWGSSLCLTGRESSVI